MSTESNRPYRRRDSDPEDDRWNRTGNADYDRSEGREHDSSRRSDSRSFDEDRGRRSGSAEGGGERHEPGSWRQRPDSEFGRERGESGSYSDSDREEGRRDRSQSGSPSYQSGSGYPRGSDDMRSRRSESERRGGRGSQFSGGSSAGSQFGASLPYVGGSQFGVASPYGGGGAQFNPGSQYDDGQSDFGRGTGSEIGGWHSEGGYRGRGPKQYKRSDERLMEDVCERLTQDPRIDASEIVVTVTDGEVTLKGEVPDRRQKHLAEDVIESVSGVKDINNQVRVASRSGTSGNEAMSSGGSSQQQDKDKQRKQQQNPGQQQPGSYAKS